MPSGLHRFPLQREGQRPEVPGASPFFLVVGGGPEPDPERLRAMLPEVATVIAADGGWRLARSMGLTSTLLVGDMDTLSPDEVEQARLEGAEVRRYRADKDESDLEIAILAAHQMGARQMTILGALGGQWDHCLLNLLAPLSLCQSLGIWARLLTSEAEIYLLSPGLYSLSGQVGTRASLAALSPTVEGLNLRGFLYPLESATLARKQTLGLANAIGEPRASVNVGSGELLLTMIR